MPNGPHTDYPFVADVVKTLNQGLVNRLILAPWYRFDTVHYLEIADGGYSYPVLTAWAPVYPLLIRILSGLGINPMAAALIVSSAGCFAALLVIYHITQEIAGKQIAQRVLIGIILFPSSFFLVAGYTESLFMALSAAFIWMLWKKEWIWAGILGAIASLTRFQGAALALPAVWAGWEAMRGLPAPQKCRSVLTLKSPFWAVGLPPTTLLVWIGWQRFGMNEPWPWELLSQYWKQHSGFPWEGIVGNLTSLLGFRHPVTAISLVAQFYDLVLVSVAILAIIIAIRNAVKIPVIFHIWAWATVLTLLIKVDNNWLLVSASRYLLGAFPIFICIPLWLKQKGTWLSWLIFSFISQILLLICFYFWIWVA